MTNCKRYSQNIQECIHHYKGDEHKMSEINALCPQCGRRIFKDDVLKGTCPFCKGNISQMKKGYVITFTNVYGKRSHTGIYDTRKEAEDAINHMQPSDRRENKNPRIKAVRR
jgi:uncharacterized OB-fold protein